MYLYDYVIIFALESEFEQFKCALSAYKSNLLDNPDNYMTFYNSYKNKSEIDEFVMVKGNKKFKIFATTQNMTGMVSAGICATKLIADYRPQNLVLLGIAAGFEQEYGSVLIADFVTAYQQGKLIGGEIKPDGIGYSLEPNLKRILDKNKDNIIQDVQKAVLTYQKNNENLKIQNIGAYIGTVVTSLHVIADENQQKIIKSITRKAIGVEMEGFGIFQAVSEFKGENKPIPMLIKSVCDHADITKSDDYQKVAGFTAAYFFLKHLEIDIIKPLPNLPKKSSTLYMPFGYIERQEYFKRIIDNAPEGTDICFISITGGGELTVPGINTDRLISAFKRGNKLKGIVVNPNGLEARFRNAVESPNLDVEETILSGGASRVLQALRQYWKNSKIEMKHSPVGVGFKLWLTETAAMIEPYHFGKENKQDYDTGLCGFSQILYSNNDREYIILRDHFNNLWERSETFWPEWSIFNRVEIEINTHCNKKEDTGNYCKYCPNSVSDTCPPKLMDEQLYKKIISELKEIGFRGRLSFHFYGEPLLHPNIEALINHAKIIIPEADLVLYTNGDKLTDSKYDNLIKSGIDRIVVFNPYKKFTVRPKQTVLRNIHFNNKGGMLGRVQTLDLECFAPTHRLVIGYDGNVLLCYEDVKRQNIFGNVGKQSIKEIWSSARFEKAREELKNGQRCLYEPCKYCNNQSHVRFGQVNVNYFY